MKKKLMISLLICLGGIAVCALSPVEAQNITRVMFIGNSYTSSNDLAGVFQKLAASGDRRVAAANFSYQGFRLMQHVHHKPTYLSLRAQHWDFVILQEDVDVALDKQRREKSMLPAVRMLKQLTEKNGGKAVLLLPWGQRDGKRKSKNRSFAKMQSSLTRSHVGMADDLNLMIAPAGEAFGEVLDTREDIRMFQRDGRHPSAAGTYLTACVIYATIFQKSPYGLEYSAGLDPGKARYLQDLAGEIVFRGYKQWNVPDPRASH